MPQIGPLEILVVSVIALIVFGPQRLPEMARSIGKALSEFKRQAGDIRAEFESGLDVEDEPAQPGPIVHKGTTNTPSEPVAKLPQDPDPVPAIDPDPVIPAAEVHELDSQAPATEAPISSVDADPKDATPRPSAGSAEEPEPPPTSS